MSEEEREGFQSDATGTPLRAEGTSFADEQPQELGPTSEVPRPVEPAPAVTPVGPTAQEPLPPAGGAPAGPPATPRPVMTGDVSDDDRLLAALSWLSLVVLQLPVVSVVLLLAEPNKSRPFQRFHAVSSVAFWLVSILYEVLAGVVYTILGIITAGCGLACLWPIFLVPHAIGLFYAYEAYMGRRPNIPVLSDFVRSQGWA